MSNFNRFRFDDFTLENYRRYIKIAKEKFIFRTFDNFNKNENFILLRHDIDFSVHAAKKLALIEKEEEVISTYFLHLHSKFYNLLEKEITEIVFEIINLGHRIGLHFDTHFFKIEKEKDLNNYLILEKDFLEKIFNVKINVFSFHNTTNFTMNCKKWEYSGLINTYADYFQKNVTYCSDSNGYWKFEKLEDVLRDHNNGKIQILTHPEWWQEKVMSPIERIWHCIDGRSAENKKYYIDFLNKNGQKIIDW